MSRPRRPPRLERLGTGLPSDPLWYKDAVVYEVPVRAYLDSDGDGIGDFRGLTARLDYLRDLGVTAIWVLPFYPSPGRDDGYDIADYTTVNPDYGTLADVRTFIREAHRRGLRVITELVCNHTSDQHPWFQRARRAAPGSAARDFYVWSDSPDRYRDARIIFKDFETSNWTWDPVAGAYYWHRFYSHQPDLNFDNPRVRQAIFRVMDHWLDLGVDGLRLDAIPYLYEREGTNGENLPETHGFLKSLRAHIDAHYADRMLLAEANQWPEEAVTYFGSDDECQMAFHFPVMPRMFMALRMEDSFPIVDIMDQTPPIPPRSQWALFLRNHDELTLEMVTDEERDYMYRVYADDPQARINLGIRRRLAPLLGNNRRRIELMNGLLFSLPGTPVVYYGDEIGMGDNVYLGDRNGVRTPMQWSPDRNAGFSTANRQRLFLPVVTDPGYHYETVNVDAQLSNPYSLLWWMRRLIALRRRHPAFGHGTIEFLRPENRRILAFIRQHGDETLLVVANLSRFSQWTHLDLSRFEGRVPIELFGSVEFPRIGREPWLTSLGPHAFLWFRIATDTTSTAIETAVSGDLPELAWTGELGSILGPDRGPATATVLAAWMRARRWFKGKARRPKSVDIVDAIPGPDGSDRAAVVLVQVAYTEGEPDLYTVPLIALDEADAEHLLAETPHAAIARLGSRSGSPAVLLDGTLVPAFWDSLLAFISGRRHARSRRGGLTGVPTRSFRAIRGPASERLRAAPLRGEQSNSSATFGERLILKLYRTLEDGPNPDLEVTRFLLDHGFEHVAALAGAAEYGRGGAGPATVAIAQAFVPNGGDLWELTCDAVGSFLEQARAEEEMPTEEDLSATALLAQSREDVPPVARRLMGAYLETARLLGARTGQLHVTLASDPAVRAFAPEPVTPFQQRALYQSIRSLAGESMRLLDQRRSTLPDDLRPEADGVLELAREIDARLRPLVEHRVGGMLIRIHGDYHLGQILHGGRDIAIIDFEGEPARPLSERRLKRPALTDVAGMLRSFHYAAFSTIIRGDGEAGPENDRLRAWARAWYGWAATTFLRGYQDATAGAAFLPGDEAGMALLLDALLLAKASYELRYELNSRPDWVGIPLAGIRELLAP